MSVNRARAEIVEDEDGELQIVVDRDWWDEGRPGPIAVYCMTGACVLGLIVAVVCAILRVGGWL